MGSPSILQMYEEIYKDIFISQQKELICGKRSPGWEKFAESWIKNHPFCAICGAKKYLEVHHIKPFHLFPALEFDEDNLVTLCMTPYHYCHFVFGHHWNWSNYNKEIWQTIAFIKSIRA